MIRDIEIKAVANGFIVSVGCQRFVFQSLPIMLTELGRYLANPEATEKFWRQAACNIKHTLNQNAALDPPANMLREEAQCARNTYQADYRDATNAVPSTPPGYLGGTTATLRDAR